MLPNCLRLHGRDGIALQFLCTRSHLDLDLLLLLCVLLLPLLLLLFLLCVLNPHSILFI